MSLITRASTLRPALGTLGIVSILLVGCGGGADTDTVAGGRTTTTAPAGGSTSTTDASGATTTTELAGATTIAPSPSPSSTAAAVPPRDAGPDSAGGGGAPAVTVPAALLQIPGAAVPLTAGDATALAAGVGDPQVDRCAVGAALRTMLAANPASPADSDAYVAALAAAVRAAAAALPAAITASGANAAPDLVERVTAIGERLTAEAAAGPGAADRLRRAFSGDDFDRLTDAMGFLVCER